MVKPIDINEFLKQNSATRDCTLAVRINEIIDLVNTTQKEREAEKFEIQEWIDILEAVRKSVNTHEKQIDELQIKLDPEKCKPTDPYAEQRKTLEIIKKENEDKQAVLNCVVDMLKTLNQKYTLIMGKDVIKETVRLLEQTKGGDNE